MNEKKNRRNEITMILLKSSTHLTTLVDQCSKAFSDNQPITMAIILRNRANWLKYKKPPWREPNETKDRMENNINKIFDSYQQMWTCTPFEETSMHVSSVICFETQFSLFAVHTLPMCFESVCCGDLASPVCLCVCYFLLSASITLVTIWIVFYFVTRFAS